MYTEHKYFRKTSRRKAYNWENSKGRSFAFPRQGDKRTPYIFIFILGFRTTALVYCQMHASFDLMFVLLWTSLQSFIRELACGIYRVLFRGAGTLLLLPELPGHEQPCAVLTHICMSVALHWHKHRRVPANRDWKMPWFGTLRNAQDTRRLSGIAVRFNHVTWCQQKYYVVSGFTLKTLGIWSSHSN